MTAEIIPLICPLSVDAAVKRIQAAVGTTKLGWTDHVMEKLGDTISAQQALAVLSRGDIVQGPTWSREYDDWICVFSKVIAGRRVHAVVALENEGDDVTVVTVY